MRRRRALRDVRPAAFSSPVQGVEHPGSQAIEPNKQQAVDAVEIHPLRRFAPQDIRLVPKHQYFGLQSSARPEQPFNALIWLGRQDSNLGMAESKSTNLY
jgi:hypothetical protein